METQQTTQNKNKREIVFSLTHHNYKAHQGKAWVAKIDPQTKKILEFVQQENTEYDGNTTEKFFRMDLNDPIIYRFRGRSFDFIGTVAELSEQEECYAYKKIHIDEEQGNVDEAIAKIKAILSTFTSEERKQIIEEIGGEENGQ